MDDHHMFEAATVTGVFLVEIDVMLSGPRRLTDDEVTDLVETIVDHLDERSVDPSVGTRRQGDDVAVSVVVTIAEAQEFDAMAAGVAATKAAFVAAGVGAAGVAEPHDLRSRVLPPVAA
jgi:hypothetical protein